MQITIREVGLQDFDQLCELMDLVDELHLVNLPQLFQKPRGPVHEEEYIFGLIEDESVGLLIAEIGGQLIGFVHLILCEARPIPIFAQRWYAMIDNLGVKEEFRRFGVGRALMEQAHQWALAKGASSIELNVFEFNQDAIAFYCRLGYETLSRRMSKSLK